MIAAKPRKTQMVCEQIRPQPGTWPLIAAIVVVTGLWMAAAGLSLHWFSAVLPVLTCLGLELLSAFYRLRRPDLRLAATLTALAQLIAFTGAAAPLSYAVAGTGGPLWDATLLSWDRTLGLDWRAYLAFVDARPTLGLVYTIAYQSIMAQMVVIVVVLGFTGRLLAVRDFVLAFVIAGLAVILISGLMPAMAMFVHLGLQPQDFPHLNPAAAFVHVGALTGLRDGTLRLIALDQLEGIITFPSFHSALGVIFIHALWSVRWLRWPALTLNGLLIAATPIDGGHYFVDVFAGGAIAFLALSASRFYNRHLSSGANSFTEGAADEAGLQVRA